MLQRLNLDLRIPPAQGQEVERLQVLEDHLVLEFHDGREGEAIVSRQCFETAQMLRPELNGSLSEPAHLGPRLALGGDLGGSRLQCGRAEGQTEDLLRAWGRPLNIPSLLALGHDTVRYRADQGRR